LKSALRTLLLSAPNVTDLVGDGVYITAVASRPSYPYLLLTQTSADEWETLTDNGGTRRVEFDIDAKARTAGEAERLIRRVRQFLRNYTGPAGPESVQAVEISGEASDHEPPTDGREFGVFVDTIDVAITYSPADE